MRDVRLETLDNGEQPTALLTAPGLNSDISSSGKSQGRGVSLHRLAHGADGVGGGDGVSSFAFGLAADGYAHRAFAVELSAFLYYQLLDDDIAIDEGGLGEDEEVIDLYLAIDAALEVGILRADIAVYEACGTEDDLTL